MEKLYGREFKKKKSYKRWVYVLCPEGAFHLELELNQLESIRIYKNYCLKLVD